MIGGYHEMRIWMHVFRMHFKSELNSVSDEPCVAIGADIGTPKINHAMFSPLRYLIF